MAGPRDGVQIPIEARLQGFDAAFKSLVTGAQQASDRMGSAFGRLRGIAATLGLGISAVGFSSFVKGSIDAADRLNDLSKATGVAVQSLGGIGFAAEQAGADLDSVAKAFGKLNLLAADAKAGNEKAISTFQKLGISLAEIRSLKPEELFAKVTAAFASFPDGADKAAGANAVFSKSYQGILPLLDEGAESLQKNIDYFNRYAKVTDELVKQSDAFNDELTKSSLLIRSFGNQLAVSLLPSMQRLTEHFTDAAERGEGFAESAAVLAGILRTLAVPVIILAGGFVQLGEAIAGAAAASVQFFSGNFKQAGSVVSDLGKRLDEIGARYINLAANVFKGTAAAADAAEKGASGRKRGTTPSFGDAGSKSNDDTAKRLLDQRIRGLENEIRAEQTLLRDRDSFLQDYYQDNLVDIEAFFQKRGELQRDALAVELRAYDDMEVALQERLQSADPKDRIDIENKLSEVVGKRAAAEQATATRGIQLWFDERRAVDEFRKGVEQAALQVEQLRGNQVTAAGFGFDVQNAELLKRIELEKQSADLTQRNNARIFSEKMSQLREMTVAQARFNQEQIAFAGVADEVSAAQTRIAIAVQSGQATELEGLARLSAANRSRLDDMQQVIDRAEEAYDALAKAFGENSPITQAAARDLDILKLKMEELAATGDLVARKFNDIGQGAFSTFLQDLTTGKFKDAVANLGKNLSESLTRTFADNLSQKAFAKDGPLSGFGDLFSSLLGGGAADATGAVALTTAGTTLTAAGTVQTTAGAALSAAAAALASAAAALVAAATGSAAGDAAGGIGSILGSLLGGGGSGGGFAVGPQLGFAANGSNFTTGGPYMVGEFGREIVVPPKGSRVIPNHKLGGQSVTVTNNFTVDGQVSTATQRQIAANVGRSVRGGLARG